MKNTYKKLFYIIVLCSSYGHTAIPLVPPAPPTPPTPTTTPPQTQATSINNAATVEPQAPPPPPTATAIPLETPITTQATPPAAAVVTPPPPPSPLVIPATTPAVAPIIAPVATITPAVVPAEITTPVAPPASTPTPTPAIVSTSPDTTPPPLLASYKTEVEQINTQLQNIVASKTRMKELLLSIDNDITAAKALVSDARTKSLDLLKQGNTDQAKTIDADVSLNLTTITDLRKKVLETTTSAFQAESDKIQQAMKQITLIIEQLKAKGVAFQATQAQTLQQADVAAQIQPQQSSNLPEAWAIKSKETPSTSITAQQQPTMIHYAFHRIADVLSKIARVCYVVTRSCKEAIWEKSTPVHAKPGNNPPAAPTTPPINAPTKPSTYSFVAHEAGIAALEETRNSLSKSAATIEQRIHQLSLKLASNKTIGLAVQTDISFFEPIQQRPAWRQTTEHYFSRCLDGITWIFQSTKATTAHTYHTYIEPAFARIHHDVEMKMTPKPHSSTLPSATIPTIPAHNG